MWSHIPARSLIDFQRAAALEQMGERARSLLAEGYAVEADRVLDEMAERRRGWSDDRG